MRAMTFLAMRVSLLTWYLRASRPSHGVYAERALQLGDLIEAERHGGLATEDGHEHLELGLVCVDLRDRSGEVCERARGDANVLALLVLDAGCDLLALFRL